MIFTIFILLVGGYLIRNTNYLREHGVETQGRVVVAGGYRSMPVIEYVVNGQILQTRYKFTSLRSSVRRPVDSHVQIKFNPNRPESLWIIGDKAPYFMGIMIIIMGSLSLGTRLMSLFF